MATDCLTISRPAKAQKTHVIGLLALTEESSGMGREEEKTNHYKILAAHS